MNKEKIINRLVLPAIYVAGWLTVYLLPRKMFNVGGDSGADGWIIFFVLFVGLPLILYLTLKRNGIKGDKLKALALGSAFLAIPFTYLVIAEDKKELKTYGVETVGIIDKAWQATYSKRPSVWSVQAEYRVNGKEYRTSTKEDADTTLNLGDTVTIIYSSKTPEMSQIKELMERYKEE